MTVSIVAGSTGDLPESLIEKTGIKIAPIYINIGDREHIDRVEMKSADFYAGLPNFPFHLTTGTPCVDHQSNAL
jgi:fatty acid-binding protein DegV